MSWPQLAGPSMRAASVSSTWRLMALAAWRTSGGVTIDRPNQAPAVFGRRRGRHGSRDSTLDLHDPAIQLPGERPECSGAICSRHSTHHHSPRATAFEEAYESSELLPQRIGNHEVRQWF